MSPFDRSSDGIVHELRESPTDIVVRRGHGDDVFVKAGGDVLLLDEAEARLLEQAIRETVATDIHQSEADPR